MIQKYLGQAKYKALINSSLKNELKFRQYLVFVPNFNRASPDFLIIQAQGIFTL